jgi:hypothetical protein
MGEMTLQFFSADNTVTSAVEGDYSEFGYWLTSDLGYQPSQGRHSSKKLTSEGKTIYDVVYTIGDDGFRITPSAQSGERTHINFFGCSFMFGEGLDDNETMPFFFQAMANHVSVKNFGSSGYGVHQALRILESDRDTTADINFLLTSPWHAERSACGPVYSKGSPRYRLADDGAVVLDGSCLGTNIFSRIMTHSRIYQLARQVQKVDQDLEIDLYLAIIGRIKQLSRKAHQRFIVGFIKADNAWFTGTYSNDKMVGKLAEMGIEVIDLTLAPSAEEISEDLFIHALDKHPSAKANETRAKILKQHLRSHPSLAPHHNS